MSYGANSRKEARQFRSGQTLSVARPRIASDEIRVTLESAPESLRTSEFLKRLIADARAWDEEQKKGDTQAA